MRPGQRWLTGIILIAVGLNIVAALSAYLSRDADRLMNDLIGLLLLLGVSVFVYHGYSLTRWLLCASLVFRGVRLLLGGISLAGPLAWLDLLSGAAHLLCALLLALLPSINAFFAEKARGP